MLDHTALEILSPLHKKPVKLCFLLCVCSVCRLRIWRWATTVSGFSLDGVTLLFPTVGTRRSQGIRGRGAGCRASAPHLAHLIVLSGLPVVPLGLPLPLRLSLGLPPSAVTAVPAVSLLVGMRVLRLMLHLGVGILLSSPPLQSACKGRGSSLRLGAYSKIY